MIHESNGSPATAGGVKLRTGRFLPLAIDVTAKRCLVIGGGRIGTRKTLTLLGAGADVTVISPEASGDVERLAVSGRVRWLRRRYQPGDPDGFFLAVAATADPQRNQAIGRDARRAGVLACVVSSSADSDTIFPATHAVGPLTIAVHSDGRRCRRSKEASGEIARWLSREASPRNGEAAEIPSFRQPGKLSE
ncbi:MAG TPA: bifunctional precorrin-2 dehydrogenase/sirohydrochlorin ferrochelatase [Thermoguttaceae bacterium]|nr:bifunctional precorrin-2 dehydrogenase/sirohydrochlorin ferrochelatase [Thermoguttaceae bacterium]